MALARERPCAGIERRVRAARVGQVCEHAIIGVRPWCAQRLLGDRQDAPATLARRLRHELLEPQAEAGKRVGDHERELVASAPRQLRERQPQRHARAGAPATGEGPARSGVPRQAGALEQPAHIDADERRRHHAEGR